MVVNLDMKKIFVLLFLVFFSYPLYAQVMYLECSNIDRVFQMKLTNYWKIDFDNENAQLKSMGFIADYLIRDTDNTSFIIIYREFIYSDEDLAYFKEIGMLEEVLTDPYWKEHSFEVLVDYIQFSKEKDLKAPSDYFEQVIDGMVYELYFSKEIKKANKEILKHLGDLKPLQDKMKEKEKFEVIQSEFDRLYDPNHSVRNHLETLDSVEEVRIIRETVE